MIARSRARLWQARQDVAKIDELVASHDVVFLLLDTRGRWLRRC